MEIRPIPPCRCRFPQCFPGFPVFPSRFLGVPLSPAGPWIKSGNVGGAGRPSRPLGMGGDGCRKSPETFPLKMGKIFPRFPGKKPPFPPGGREREKCTPIPGIPVQTPGGTGCQALSLLLGEGESRGENAHFARMLRIRSSMMPRSWGLVFIRLSTFLIV